MSKEENTTIDLDTLSDDEVNKLEPEQIQQLMEQEVSEDQEDEITKEPETQNDDGDDTTDPNSNSDDRQLDVDENEEVDSPEIKDKSSSKDSEELDEETDLSKSETSKTSDKPSTEKADSQNSNKSSKDEPKKEAKSTQKSDNSKESDKDSKESTSNESTVTPEAMAEFYNKLHAPFKANGKDITVRTAEDAIKLMQMGSGYSKRMQELKPLRAMHAMLEEHGLNDSKKLSYLIDLQAGKPDAIQKLLKENKIDPLDIDVNKDTNYQEPDYSPDESVVTFKQAIQDTMAVEGGKELITEITDTNGLWDNDSKEKLKENPNILNNLLDQHNSGMYTKIKEEVNYQRTLGYLPNVPFLQAYHLVGNAMEKAGVFSNSKTTTKDMSISTLDTPIDTGPRKAKTEKPNPNLSSTQQPRTVKQENTEEQQDYSSMSDKDFLKMAPPS